MFEIEVRIPHQPTIFGDGYLAGIADLSEYDNPYADLGPIGLNAYREWDAGFQTSRFNIENPTVH